MCLVTPATTARTRFKFGFHLRRRVLFAWLTIFPYCGPLPHNSHFIAIIVPAQSLFVALILPGFPADFCRKTKLLILPDPPTTAKCAFSGEAAP
jgi:hypothetical protein